MSKNTLYSLEGLKKKAELALKDPELVKIAKTAFLYTKDTSNLTRIYSESFVYVLGKISDLKKSKELALSTRFLAMIRRDYPEEFEKLVIEKSAKPVSEEPKKEISEPPEKKRFDEIELEIPDFVELITTESIQSYYIQKKRLMKFPNEYSWSCVWSFCLNILDKMVVRELSKNPKGDFKKYFINDLATFLEKNFDTESLIEILEKRGLKIKVCGNCFYRGGDPISGGSYCKEHPAHLSKSFDNSCGAWKTPSKN